MPTVTDLLIKKGRQVWCTEPTATVRAATRVMNEHRVGALMVCESDKVLGVFTERDVLTRVVAEGSDPDATLVNQVMTSPVAYCTPDTSVDQCRSIMTEKRIRHLPVMEDKKLVGVVTVGDVLAHEAQHLQQTVRYLEDYIHS